MYRKGEPHMQVRFGRVKVSGFHVNAAIKWEREGCKTREEILFEDLPVSASRLFDGSRSAPDMNRVPR